MGDSKPKQEHHPVVVVVVPFPAQIHLNQILQLSSLICTNTDIPVHYDCSATHVRQVRHRYNNQRGIAKINFGEFPTPNFTSPPPDPTVRFPVHLQPSFNSTLELREPMADFLREISQDATRVIIIHDILMSYVVQDSTEISPTTKCYIFGPTGAFPTYYDIWQFVGRSYPIEEEESFKVFLESHEL